MDFVMSALKDRLVDLIEKYTGGSGRRRRAQAKVIENAFERQKTVKEAVRQIPMGQGNEDESDHDNYENEDNDHSGKYSEKDIKEILYPKDNFQIYLTSSQAKSNPKAQLLEDFEPT